MARLLKRKDLLLTGCLHPLVCGQILNHRTPSSLKINLSKYNKSDFHNINSRKASRSFVAWCLVRLPDLQKEVDRSRQSAGF